MSRTRRHLAEGPDAEQVHAYDIAGHMVDALYDVTNPATEVANPGSQGFATLIQYTIDGLGNRSQVQTPPPTPPSSVTYAVDVVNQYTTLGGVSRVRDNNGNLRNDGTQLYVYDYKNRLVEVKLKSSGTSIWLWHIVVYPEKDEGKLHHELGHVVDNEKAVDDANKKPPVVEEPSGSKGTDPQDKLDEKGNSAIDEAARKIDKAKQKLHEPKGLGGHQPTDATKANAKERGLTK